MNEIEITKTYFLGGGVELNFWSSGELEFERKEEGGLGKTITLDQDLLVAILRKQGWEIKNK